MQKYGKYERFIWISFAYLMNIDYLCSPYTNTERNNKKNEKIINNNLDADHHDDQHDGSTCQ